MSTLQICGAHMSPMSQSNVFWSPLMVLYGHTADENVLKKARVHQLCLENIPLPSALMVAGLVEG